MLSLWVIRRSLHINNIHKNNNSVLIIPTFVNKILFLPTKLHILGAGGSKIVLRFLLMEFVEVQNVFSSESNCAK